MKLNVLSKDEFVELILATQKLRKSKSKKELWDVCAEQEKNIDKPKKNKI